jgi:hypothetical protein
MTVNFPDSPAIGDLVTIGDKKRRWSGKGWSTVTGAVVSSIAQSDSGVIDLSNGTYHKILVDSGNSNVSFSFSGFAAGSSRWFVELTITTIATLDWPSSIYWSQNGIPIISSNHILILEFYSPDGGTTIYGIESINRNND